MPRKIRASNSVAPRLAPMLLASSLALAVGCSAAPEDADQPLAPATGSAGSSGTSPNTGSGPGANPLGRTPCRAPAGVSGSPQTTQEAVALLNALPKPTGVACFLESLERPLTVYATSSASSAQPALSASSPRVFVKLGNLWLSVVIDGESSYLMEFGDLLPAEPLDAPGAARSIKGELQLPIDDVVPASAPYDRVRYGGGTACGLCHYDERPVEGAGSLNSFSSVAFRPRPDTRVDVANLKNAAATCDWQAQPHRCEMLAAVFNQGTVNEEPFPTAMLTFF